MKKENTCLLIKGCSYLLTFRITCSHRLCKQGSCFVSVGAARVFHARAVLRSVPVWRRMGYSVAKCATHRVSCKQVLMHVITEVKDYRIQIVRTRQVGHGGSVVSLVPCVRRVAVSNPALTAT